MSNDEIKKFIDHSKLYTEVDFEQNKKVEEGVLDFIKGLFKSDDEAEEVIKKADPEVVKQLDKAVDNNDLDAFGGTGAPVVTTQDQANSILQNPNATDAERQAAQEFYGKEKTSSDNTGKVAKPGSMGGTTTSANDGPQVDTGAGANAQANISQNDTSSDSIVGDDPSGAGDDGVDPDATDPRGDQTNPPANQQGVDGPADSAAQDNNPNAEVDPSKQGIDGPADAAAMAAGQAGAAAATAPSNGSLLGRKLDTTTPNLMKAYNDGGKKAMPAIKNMQTALSRLGHDPNGIDGKYGKGTYAAVQAFQKANGLTVDGQAGPGTMAAIKKALDDNFEKNKATPADQDQSPQDGAEPEQKSAAQKAADEFAGGDVQGGEFAGTGNTTDDAMDPKNQQKDINTAQPNADLGRYVELLNKLEGGQVNASYDFRDLIALVESKLLNEKLTPAEMEELKALHNKVQGHVGIDAELDTKITAALNRYLKLVKEPADKADAQNKASDAQLIAKGKAAKADAQNKASDSQLIAKAQSAEPKVSKELYVQMAPNRNASLGNFNVSKMKAKYPKPYVDIPNKDGTITRGYGPLKNLEDFVANQGKKFKAKIIGKPAQQAGVPNAERDGAERGVQTASKDNNMKKAIEEASMNISINGDSAAEVAELAGILKNAGMHDAKPVSDIMPHAGNSHDDMMSKMAIVNDPEMDSPCGMDEEGVEEDWDNSPDESYADTQTMTHDLSGGINRQKKAYAKAQDGDNAMAVETSIKEQLWAALNEKMTAEGRGRGKTLKASRGEKLNASRGNKLMASRGKDKKTTEGSRGKKSRGKKSRG